jgi:hypothetical protein
MILAAAGGVGAVTAVVTSVNQTQAVLQEQGFAGPCTVQVSTSSTFAQLHPDVDAGKYPGSSQDTGRADTVTTSNGSVRLVTLGHLTGDRALAAYTVYYYRVSGCGGTVGGSFMTGTLSYGTTRTEQSPFDASKWGNLGLPTFDWTARKAYVDPLTGAQLLPMATATTTWRSTTSRAFSDWSGGAGWSNPSGVLQGASTTASTGTTAPLDVYGDISAWNDPRPYSWNLTLEDIGVVAWGGGSNDAAADRTVDLCIFLNPAQGCASNTVQVILPQGPVSHVTSGSSDADGAFPAAFPSSPFFGWTGNVSPLIRMENRETFGTLSVSGNTLSIGGLNTSQHFSSALNAGQKIFLAGSACPNSLCTVSGVPLGPGTVTVSDVPGVSGGNFRAYGWGVRVWKDNPNGVASVGLQFKLAGSSYPIGIQSLGDKCSPVQVTSGDGKQGTLCSLTSIVTGYGYLAFIATDGTTRIIALAGTGYSIPYPFSFDDLQGNVFYAGTKNTSGGLTVNEYTYTGDYTGQLDYGYRCQPVGPCPVVNLGISAPVDLMPHALNADLDQQIEANQGVALPPYNAAIYGSWTQSNGAIGYYGSSGHFALFCNVYSGQGQPTSGGPGWCASVDLSQNPAQVTRLIHTLDGTGAPAARFGSLHSAQAVDSSPNTTFLSLDDLDGNNRNTLHGGPFQAPVQSLLMADGTWSTNTCLDWPAGAGSCPNPNYYGPCPSNSGVYTQCVTFRLPQNGVCNVAPTAIEQKTWPCPWNSGYSQYPLMRSGDNAADLAATGGVDSEHFHILSVTLDSGNTLRVVAARNGTYDYCSISPWHGATNTLSAQYSGQLSHSSGWTLTMMPGSVDSCGWSVLLQDQIRGTVEELGHTVSGHFDIGVGAHGLNFVTTAASLYNTPFTSLGQIPPVYTKTAPSFQGVTAQIGSQLQSYTSASQLNAGSAGASWAIDLNPLVSCVAESLGCGVLRTTIPVAGAVSVYKIEAIGSAAQSNATYKTQPMIGWAGRFQLKDVSGPSSSVDTTPYAMCFVVNAGECHAGSVPNEIYVNVPAALDPGYCAPGLSWANVPCVLFGDNAPAGGIRQFTVAASDPAGFYSRFVSNGWSSLGRHYPYSHATTYGNGQWLMVMGTNPVDGYSTTGFLISVPPLPAHPTQSDNTIRQMAVKASSGYRYAEVQFGYSRYIGPQQSPANGLYCTARAESCNTSAPALFNFESEARTPTSCGGGCTVNVPEVGPNVLYYRLRQSNDGVTWVNSDVAAVAIP